jgi:hypothetical protein
LAEQLADEEDPLQIKLRESFDEEVFGSPQKTRARHPKRVRYQQNSSVEHKSTHAGIKKEDIDIPVPRPRRITWAEKAIATVMTGNRQASQMHGLTGKPLL